MIPMPVRLALVAALLPLAACERADRNAPVRVALVGEQEATLRRATTLGLVRHDAAGQIEPGLAIRWAISEDGLFYTFRLARLDGLDAYRVAARLRAAVAAGRNPLRPLLGAVAEVVAVTPEVVEIRLSSPRPNFLDLLAQPELALSRPGEAGGPLGIERREGNLVSLLPVASDPAADPAAIDRERVIATLERPSVGVIGFLEGQRDLVLGGRFIDLPVVRAARPRSRDLRFDPAEGLFGLAFANERGLLADPEIRHALAMAIDREALVAAFAPADWPTASSILPAATTEVAAPAAPDWAALPLAERRTRARAAFAGRGGERPVFEIALPKGPGATLLFNRIAADWRAIGISARRVAPGARADLRLVDAVAPSESATWYLRRFECARSAVCSPAADRALAAARTATDPAERSALIAEADAGLAEIGAFIPLARPLRWMLVSPRLTGVQTNNRAVHPLNRLLPSID